MKTFKFYLKWPLIIYFFIASITLNAADTLAPSGEELELSYKTSFITHFIDAEEFNKLTQTQKKELSYEAANDHFKHIFGILQSIEFAKLNFVPSKTVLGTGAPLLPAEINVNSSKANKNTNQVYISYEVRGKFLIHKNAAQLWLQNKSVNIPLLVDMPSIYNDEKAWEEKWVHCTDEHYTETGDFFYFNNPYRNNKNCKEILSEPISKNVKINVSKVAVKTEKNKKNVDLNIPLQKMLEENGNGKWYTLYFIQGYAEDFKTEQDEGTESFNSLQEKLSTEYGFIEIKSTQEFNQLTDHFPISTVPSLSAPDQGRFIKTYIGEVKDHMGNSIPTLVRSILTDTSFDGKRKTFAKFWKEAWEQGDFIFYNGHSGLGGHMSQDNLLYLYETYGLEPIQFNKNKTQVAFLDSCSSYSYYSEEYKSAQPELFIITNALASYFDTSAQITDVFLDNFLTQTSSEYEINWNSFLNSVENSMKSSPQVKNQPSYLINVRY